MTIATRRLNEDTITKATRFLEQVEEPLPNNMYFYRLDVKGESDKELYLEALLHLYDKKIAIKRIWVLEYDKKRGMYSARNDDGERGRYAKILGEKYLNSFLTHLDMVDINNVRERYFLLTADLVKRVESEVDQSIDSERITEVDIVAYDRIELTASAEQALRWFCRKVGESDDVTVSYSQPDRAFDAIISSRRLSLRISLAEVVNKKWETGECFSKALIMCACDLIIMSQDPQNNL